jgi:hypothetical protein
MHEIRRLQGCINDLIGVVGLSAVWGDEPWQIVRAGSTLHCAES